MSLVNCPECDKEVSDRAGNCIHCGCPLSCSQKENTAVVSDKTDATHTSKAEEIVHQAIDVVFGLMYLYLAYIVFFSDELQSDAESGAYYFGLIIGFAMLYFVQKLLKSILGTIARSFDVMFTNKKT